MKKLFSIFSEFTPKSWLLLKEGYSKKTFFDDLIAGISVGIISLPLTMAFAIASGVSPERGLYTGIIAGFLISLLGGSRVQIAGPTGAFVVVVFGIVERQGYEGLALATLIAAVLMILLALVRAGALLKFIPYPVVTGFTAGIALTIFSSQVKDLLGLPLASVPVDFIDKWIAYSEVLGYINPYALLVGLASLILIFALRQFAPKIPGPVVAVFLSALFVAYFELPVGTIESKFGQMPASLPFPAFPEISFEKIQKVFPDAMTIALLGSIESLLSALVADGMTGNRHRSNTELFAQGIGNIGSVLFGGIPATGAIARTAANIRLGAKTPLAGIWNALTLLFFMLFLSPFAVKIPLPSLAAVLIFIAWNMSERAHIKEIFKGEKSDALILVVTFLLTVLVDLTVAVQAGVLLASVIFLKKMTDATTVRMAKLLAEEKAPIEIHDSDLIFRKDVPSDVAVFEVNGPLFFAVAASLKDELMLLTYTPRVFILRLHKVPLIDASGVHALKEFALTCKEKNILFIVSGVKNEVAEIFKRSSLDQLIGKNNLYKSFQEALAASKPPQVKTETSASFSLS